jgi:hypothetical protein
VQLEALFEEGFLVDLDGRRSVVVVLGLLMLILFVGHDNYVKEFNRYVIRLPV